MRGMASDSGSTPSLDYPRTACITPKPVVFESATEDRSNFKSGSFSRSMSENEIRVIRKESKLEELHTYRAK